MQLSISKFLVLALTAVSLSTIAATSAFTQPPSAAIVKAGMPGEDPELITVLSSRLRSAGYAVSELNADDLSDAAKLTADLLILSDSSILPGKSTSSIDAYLKKGGDIMALKAPMWQASVINDHGRWLTPEDYRIQNAGTLTDHTIFD
ncbi:MAG: hypothetical protein ACYC0V_04210, partial [Armatimonadota bacterium]